MSTTSGILSLDGCPIPTQSLDTLCTIYLNDTWAALSPQDPQSSELGDRRSDDNKKSIPKAVAYINLCACSLSLDPRGLKCDGLGPLQFPVHASKNRCTGPASRSRHEVPSSADAQTRSFWRSSVRFAIIRWHSCQEGSGWSVVYQRASNAFQRAFCSCAP